MSELVPPPLPENPDPLRPQEGLFIELYLRPGYAAEALDIKWSGRERDWFHESFYHCLPLQMANQVGWMLVAPEDFTVKWSGHPGKNALEVRGSRLVLSHFGHGIFTYTPPYVFRTPPGINLLVKAVPNTPKDGICPLEGFIETDNLRGFFTFNFRVTRTKQEIKYRKGEPMAQILPYPRGWIENFEPRVLAEGERYDEHMRRVLATEKLRADNLARAEGLAARDWNYFKGLHTTGEKFPEHQMRLPLRNFVAPGGVAGQELLVEIGEAASQAGGYGAAEVQAEQARRCPVSPPFLAKPAAPQLGEQRPEGQLDPLGLFFNS